MAPDQTTNMEDVTRICQQIRDLSATMAQARKEAGIPGQGMEIDSGNNGGDKNQALTTLLANYEHEGNLMLSILKDLNRQILAQENQIKDELTEQKLNIAKVDLGLQNLKYQRRYLLNEIARCEDFETIYQNIDLVSEEEFLARAPASLTHIPLDNEDQENNSMSDDTNVEYSHRFMLNRLQFELDERKKYDAERQELEKIKHRLLKNNERRKVQLDRIEHQLETFVGEAKPMQDLLAFQEDGEPSSATAAAKLANGNEQADGAQPMDVVMDQPSAI